MKYCLYVSEKNLNSVDLIQQFGDMEKVLYPEKGLTFEECRNLQAFEDKLLITGSPILCALYKPNELFKVTEDHKIEQVIKNIYGSCVTVASKVLDEKTLCLIPETVVEEIRTFLAKGEDGKSKAHDFIEDLGESGERSYLLRLLK
jgi:hypothetical protein